MTEYEKDLLRGLCFFLAVNFLTFGAVIWAVENPRHTKPETAEICPFDGGSRGIASPALQ